MEWVNGEGFTNEAKTEFAAGADGWLVAYAKTYGRILVTDEKPNPAIKKRIPMPNVCHQFHIPYKNTFSMLRTLEAKFEIQLP